MGMSLPIIYIYNYDIKYLKDKDFFLLKLKYDNIHQYNCRYNRWRHRTQVIKKWDVFRKYCR